jgi:glycosyltransferase involved in cell wall biosynthesis
MKIEVYAVCHNEERLLPYFLRHYSQFASMTVYDNQSTDKSVQIATAGGAKVIPFDTQGEFREDIMTEIRNTCWKESKADWVIVCDIDELVYHEDLPTALSSIHGTVILPRMFNMYADFFPTTKGQIYEEVNMGVDINSKMNIFKPSEIKAMNYDVGCHNAKPEGNYILNLRSDIITMHFKQMSPEYVISRNYYLHARQSEINRINGWNWHFGESAEATLNNFRDAKPRLVKII